MSKSLRGTKRSEGGFTIIELMIAALIFSTVLVLITVGVMYFTSMYYKGVNLSSAQTTARKIVDNIAQAVQFSGGTITTPGIDGATGASVICIGNKRYTYITDKQVVNNVTDGAREAHHGLVVDIPTSTCSNTTGIASFTNAGALGGLAEFELIGTEQRLNSLSVTRVGTTGSWLISVSVSFGKYDLFTSSNPADPDAYEVCKSGEGSQYCAAAKLTTTVEKRVNSDV
ncbi:MAG: prepilin-type N-terminal cleavage/methylation domain-containing protein [Candidatus Saccharimonadales bacterium]